MNILGKKFSAILNAISAKFNIDLTYIGYNTFWLSTGHIILLILSVATASILSKSLSAHDYGTYSFLLTLASLFTITCLHGMNTSASVSYAQGHALSLSRLFLLKLRWGMIGSFAAFVGSLYYYLNGNQTLSISLIIIGIFAAIAESALVYTAYLQGTKNFKWLTVSNIFAKILTTISVLLGVFFTHNIITLIAIYFASLAVSRVIVLMITITKQKTHFVSDEHYARSILNGWNLSWQSAFSIIASHIDKIIIFHLLGGVEVAIYTLAVLPNEQIRGIFRHISNIALPRFAEHSLDNIRKNLGKKIFLLFVGSIVVWAVYAASASFIFNLLFPDYLEYIHYTRTIGLGLIVIASISSIIITVLKSHEYTKPLIYHTLAASIFKVLLVLSLVPLYGVWGAVWCIILHHIFILLSSVLLLRRIERN